ncbi:MAG: MATE family efflux transporter [Ruminococcaceae bacterium]|nr:MATE family efflux transporter [Oscillospiraceae bacterium]
MLRRPAADRSFYRSLIAIAAPIAMQNLISALLNMVDTIMIGQLGETEIASVGLANQVTFLLHLFLFGISSGSAIFTAQYWGTRDLANIKRVLGLGLLSACAIATIFLAAGLLLPKQLLSLFSTDETVVVMGSQYLIIIAFSFVMMAVSFTFSSVLRSMGNARLPMYISAFALLFNTALNYVLIFGHFSMPALGVRGAAIATLLARIIEVVLLISVIYGRKLLLAARLREMLSFDLPFCKRYLRTTLPVVLNESLWAVGVTLYTVVYARMGTHVVASINIASTVERLAMVVFFGIANAAAVLVGNRIGADEPAEAYKNAVKLVLLGPLIGVASGMLLILTSPLILSFYQVSPDVTRTASSILVVYGLVMPFRVFNIINMVGVLRSGGDTRFTLMLDITGVWLIGVPLAFIGGLLLRLPVQQVVILIIVEEFYKVFLGIRRLRTRRWINRLNVAEQEQAGQISSLADQTAAGQQGQDEENQGKGCSQGTQQINRSDADTVHQASGDRITDHTA